MALKGTTVDNHSKGIEFSVVIPAYQAERTLGDCLQALFQYLPTGSEVIVVDDGSADNTVGLVRRFPCEVIALPENHGAAFARNRGIAAATKSIVLFLDADVIVDDYFFNRLGHHFQGEEAPDAVVGMFSGKLEDPDFPSAYKLHQQRSYHLKTPRLTKALFTAVSAVKSGTLSKSKLFDEFISGATIEDVELGHEIVSAGGLIVFDPELVVEHRKRYTWFNLISTQLKRARAMGTLFFSASGTREIVSSGRFLSIPFSFGLSLVVSPLILTALVLLLLGVSLVAFIVGGSYIFLITIHFSFLKMMYNTGGGPYILLSLVLLPFDFSLCAGAAVMGWFEGFLKQFKVESGK